MSIGEVFVQVLELLSSSHERIFSLGESLFVRLATLDLIFTGLFWASEGFPGISKLIKKLLYIGGALFFFRNYPVIFATLKDSAIYIGATLAGGEDLATGFILDPGAIMNMGYEISAPLYAYYLTLGITNIPELLLSLVLLAILYGVFLIMCICVVLVTVEFYIFVGIGSICVPFFVFPITRSFAVHMLEGMASFAIKLLTLAFVLGIIQTLYQSMSTKLQALIVIQGGMSGGVLLVLFFGGFSLFMIMRGPALVSGILSGQIAGAEATGARAMGALMMGAGAATMASSSLATKRAAKKLAKASRSTASSASNLTATTATSKASAKTSAKKSGKGSAKGGAKGAAKGGAAESPKPRKPRQKRIPITPDIEAYLGMVKNLKEGEEVQISRIKTSPTSTQGTAPDSTDTQAAMTLCVSSQMLADAEAQPKSKEKPTEKAQAKSKAKNKKEKS